MELVYDGTMTPVRIGDRVKDYKGTNVEVLGVQAPATPTATGRVTLRYVTHVADYFPSVINARWIDRTSIED